MLIIKRQWLSNSIIFILLVLVVIINSLFSIKQFHVIETFNEIQMDMRLFTDSFVVVFLTSVQLIAAITVVIMETLFVTFTANFMTEKRLKFSNYLLPILVANIIAILINMIIITVTGFNDLLEIQWLSWSPIAQIILAISMYYYMTMIDKSIANHVKMKLVAIIFAVTYGFPLLIQFLARVIFL